MKRKKKEPLSELRKASLLYAHNVFKIKGAEKNLNDLLLTLNLTGWGLPLFNLIKALTAANEFQAKQKGVTLKKI